MALYELSIDDAHLREAEQLVSLEGRTFPTLVTRWESRLFDQAWSTTLVLDYTIPLPPLPSPQTFIEVRIAAYVGGAPTKFLYFGTEMNSSVPRVAPEMENQIAAPKQYQEFRLDEHSSPVPYLKLIQTTPRIYGAGAQDYYSPAIKVERYDGVASADHLADLFPQWVANLPVVKGALLTDQTGGLWTGARYVGQTSIAILRQGKVVGMHRRTGRTDKDSVPPEIKRRDPQRDVLQRTWVAIDMGAWSTVVAVRAPGGQPELIRIGATEPPQLSSDYENPTEIHFDQLGRTLKAWRDRVILPMTKWGEVLLGQAARHARRRTDDGVASATATITHLPMLRERVDRKEKIALRGRADPDTNEVLKRPAPPVIDEDGIGAHDPFDPIELYAYYIGLHLNQRTRGIHPRYAIAMPSGWSDDRRESVLVAFRRGLFRSLPAGMVEFHDLDKLQVVDAGPAAICFAAHAFRAFAVAPKPDPVPFCAVDAGASETGLVFGLLRNAKPDEQMETGNERMIEYLEPTSIPWLGGERLLHRLAYRVYASQEAQMAAGRVPFDRPHDEPGIPALEHLLLPSPEGRANVELLADALRPLLEGEGKLPKAVRLVTSGNGQHDLVLEGLDRAPLTDAIDRWFSDAVALVRLGIDRALTKIGKEPDPFDGFRVMLGGRLGMHPLLFEKLTAALPRNVRIHRYIEPDRANLGAATVKTACALGALAMRFEKIGAVLRSEKRDAFRYRVGRNRHGQLADVLDPSVEYDVWREMGACTKPDVEVLFMRAEDDGEVAFDDPRVQRAQCRLGSGAVGQRIYLRAVGPARIEVSVGPPGGEPGAGAPCWAVDLKDGIAQAKA